MKIHHKIGELVRITVHANSGKIGIIESMVSDSQFIYYKVIHSDLTRGIYLSHNLEALSNDTVSIHT